MCRTCRRDRKASAVTSYQLENRAYDVTVLALLYIGIFGTRRDVYVMILRNFMINTIMAWFE